MKNNHEIRVLSILFFIMSCFIISITIYSFYQLNKMHQITENVYKHPLNVSNKALSLELNIFKIHVEIHKIILITKKKELDEILKNIAMYEKNTLDDLNSIKKNILGEEGLTLANRMNRLLLEWRSIRKEIISLYATDLYKMVFLLNNKNRKHIMKLENTSKELYDYARNKANHFLDNSEEILEDNIKHNIFISLGVILVILFIMFYAINKIKMYMEKLKVENKRFKKIVYEAPNPIMVYNEKGEVLIVNKMWEKLSGYKHEEINTIEKWTQKAYGKQMRVFAENIESLYADDKSIQESSFTLNTKSGKNIVWQFRSTPLGLKNDKRTVILSALDITQLKEKEELLMTQSRHAAMGEMIGMIAHQWRQPLTVISMLVNNVLVDIELDDINNENMKEYLTNILAQTEHINMTIEDFRNFFKADKSLFKTTIQVLVDDTIKLVKDSLLNNNIEVRTLYTSTTQIDTYPRELIQVFINIINNGKDILVEKKTPNPFIEIKVFDEENYVITEILNNGDKIPEDILPKIFVPYFTTKDEDKGTGLGLYMCKIIVEEHLKGKIEVENTKEGVCFRIRLLNCIQI